MNISDRYKVKKGSVRCSFDYMLYGFPRRNSVYGSGKHLIGNEDLFAYEALFFLLSYLPKRGVKLSKSFKQWFTQEGLNALFRATDELIIKIKEENAND